jgi:hypothetical protein
MKARPAVEAAFVAVLLGALTLQLAWGIVSDGMTNDEVLYISTGYRQLALGDYRLNPTHPPLAQSLAGVGLLGLPLDVPPLVASQGVLAWCWQFVHERNCAGCLLWRARVPSALLTLALAALLVAWARAVAGPGAGLAAALLAAFHPSLVAHGHLATIDAPAAALSVLSAWAFWRWLRAPGLSRALLAAFALGLAAAARVTAWILVPVFLGALLVALRDRARARPLLLATARLLLVAAVVVPLVLWAAYGFHDTPWPDELLRPPRVSGVTARALDAVEATRVLPTAYLNSMRFQAEHNRGGHPGYLLGARSRTGWWYYQPVAFLVKNTPGFLLALPVALWAGLRQRRLPPALRPRLDPALGFWLALALVVLVTASLSRIQIGERYLLAAYPFLILAVASVVPALLERRRAGLLLGALAFLHVAPTLAAEPGGLLSYFNLLAGGRLGGHRVLVDSNLDWGQDLPRLAAWMRREGVKSVQLAYQGADDPSRFGIAHEDLPGECLYPLRPPARPFEGVVVVSPTLLFELGDRYAFLRPRPPDDRAGVFFVYRLAPPPRTGGTLAPGR